MESTDTKQSVGQRMTRDVVCMGENDLLLDAYQLMVDKRFRHIPIIEDRKLVGVLSERDILIVSQTKENGLLEVPNIKISEAMSKHPITCRENSKISAIVGLMLERKIDCVPVVDEHRHLVGLITSTDLLSLLLEHENTIADMSIPFEYFVKDPS